MLISQHWEFLIWYGCPKCFRRLSTMFSFPEFVGLGVLKVVSPIPLPLPWSRGISVCLSDEIAINGYQKWVDNKQCNVPVDLVLKSVTEFFHNWFQEIHKQICVWLYLGVVDVVTKCSEMVHSIRNVTYEQLQLILKCRDCLKQFNSSLLFPLQAQIKKIKVSHKVRQECYHTHIWSWSSRKSRYFLASDVSRFSLKNRFIFQSHCPERLSTSPLLNQRTSQWSRRSPYSASCSSRNVLSCLCCKADFALRKLTVFRKSKRFSVWIHYVDLGLYLYLIHQVDLARKDVSTLYFLMIDLMYTDK